MKRTVQILGIKFLRGNTRDCVTAGLAGGLVVVPSAPVLVDMADQPDLREALLSADLALPDSGLMVLLWSLLQGDKIVRVSGLAYVKLLLETLRTGDGPAAQGGVYWVMPTTTARDRNLAWLRSQGHAATPDWCYVAPRYPRGGPLIDEQLLANIRQRRPAHVILAVGGGVQERLGWYLRNELRERDAAERGMADYRPGIHCIGAAIGFLSGDQVRIPLWADALYLGWLWRSVWAPGRFVPRYWMALRLVSLMSRYRENPPVVGPGD